MRVANTARARSHSPAGNGLEERPAPWLSPLAWVGIIGPVLFTATFLVQEVFRADEYSPIKEPVSALEAGPHGGPTAGCSK